MVIPEPPMSLGKEGLTSKSGAGGGGEKRFFRGTIQKSNKTLESRKEREEKGVLKETFPTEGER